MVFDILRTRKGKLKTQIEFELLKEQPSIDKILEFIDLYEKNNLDTIKKFKRKKQLDIKKINGALKQTINAHGCITKELVGSASKRIYGSLLQVEKKSLIIKLISKLKNIL